MLKFFHAYAFLRIGPVTGIVECSRIYHVLSNLLGMLRNSFVALSSKQYFLDFFEDAHVPMPDISGYIRERVKEMREVSDTIA